MLVPTQPPRPALRATPSGDTFSICILLPDAGQAKQKTVAEGDRFVTDLLGNHPFSRLCLPGRLNGPTVIRGRKPELEAFMRKQTGQAGRATQRPRD